MPLASAGLPEVRAETTSLSAAGAPSTTCFSPSSTQTLPVFFALAATCASS